MNFDDHLSRLRSAVYLTYGLSDVPKWVSEKTFLNDRKYSFRNHEFQLKILQDTSQEVNTQKCSQIGMTEAQGRWSLGFARVFPGTSVIYTMPYSDDAETLCKTRIDPIIAASPDLKFAANADVNNSKTKQIGSSFIYFRGTQGNTQAISIPADVIISDEIDRSNPHILSQYTSRLTHSPWKLRRNFSTPTVDGHGIALKMESSRRFKSICKCSSCGHYFIPSYYDHVKIPGFDDDLKKITKSLLNRTRWKEAKLLCPKCGRAPSLFPQHREWVQENLHETHEAAGYYISPFDAPALILPSDLVKASTEYSRVSEFINQNLGLTSQDSEDSLTKQELQKAGVEIDLKDSGLYAMGADMGLTCRIVIGRIDQDGTLVVVHREKVPLGLFEQRYRELCAEYRCVIKVLDSQPYVDLIMRLQKTDHNLYASVFTNSRRVEIFKVVEQEEQPEVGKLDVRQVQVNRDKAFDDLVGHIKQSGFVYSKDPNEDEDFINECLDLKRVQTRDMSGELQYRWEKSNRGVDHYFFALLYLYVAARLRGLSSGLWAWPEIVSTFKHVPRGSQDNVPQSIMRYV